MSTLLQLCAIVLVEELRSLDDNRGKVCSHRVRKEAACRDSGRGGRRQSEAPHNAKWMPRILKVVCVVVARCVRRVIVGQVGKR